MMITMGKGQEGGRDEIAKAIDLAVRAAAMRSAAKSDPVGLAGLTRCAARYSQEAARLLDVFLRKV